MYLQKSRKIRNSTVATETRSEKPNKTHERHIATNSQGSLGSGIAETCKQPVATKPQGGLGKGIAEKCSRFLDQQAAQRSQSHFVVGFPNIIDTAEDPFSTSFPLSKPPSGFTEKLNLHHKRGWPLHNIPEDRSHIHRFPRNNTYKHLLVLLSPSLKLDLIGIPYDVCRQRRLSALSHINSNTYRPYAQENGGMSRNQYMMPQGNGENDQPHRFSSNTAYLPPQESQIDNPHNLSANPSYLPPQNKQLDQPQQFSSNNSYIDPQEAPYLHPPPHQRPFQLPQYLTADKFITSSQGSIESIMTQAPGQFHGADGSFAVQDYGNSSNTFVPAMAGGVPIPFATPILQNDGTFQQQTDRNGQGSSLNPASADFQPASNTNNATSSFNSTDSSVDSGSTFYPASQAGPLNAYEYNGTNPTGQYQTQGSYGPGYGPPGSLMGHNGLPDSYSHNGYVPPQGHMSAYGPGGHNPYAPIVQPSMAYGRPNMQTGTANQNRFAQYESYHNQNQVQNQYAVQQHNQGGYQQNNNRGNFVNHGNNNPVYMRNQRHSNVAPAPVMNANINRAYTQPQYQHGGPVHPGPAVQAPAPSQNHASQRVSSGASETKYATPRPQEFKVEKQVGHETPTPILRSRRGQDVSSVKNNKATATWIEGVSSNGDGGVAGGAGESQNFPPPPKMGGLGISGSGENSTTPKSADPFTSTPSSGRPFNNPFGASQGQITTYNGGGPVTNVAMGPSAELRRLTDNGTRKPTIAEALETANLPLSEYCRLAKEDTWGVIKIKNIPYSVNRPEIMAFLGRNARLISDVTSEPVHIVMERVTSKTLDAYVEFTNFNEAVNAVNRFETNRSGGRGGRLGHRHVEVELSSQEALMKDLFPKAKNVQWKGSKPIIIPRDPNDEYNSGFQGFISKEELLMLVKHVEAPQRSPFSKECPQRPFECIISTLFKYPWYMVDYITIEDRHLLHQATVQLLFLLRGKLEVGDHDPNLTPQLLKRIWRAALKCPGFSPSQRDDIIISAGLDIRESIDNNVPPFAAEWKYLLTIGPKPGAPYDLVYYYAATIREATEKKEYLSLAEKAAKGVEKKPEKLFGELDAYIDLPADRQALMQMKLSAVAALEWAGIEKALRFALE